MKLEEIGKTALSKDAPDPKQVQYESPEFDKLTQEIGKLGSLHGETVEWRDVIETSTIIIRDKSKDLEVVTYLCRGLWERDGYAGLRVGFTILRDIIQEYWDIAYPPKKKARMRGGKISWLVDRVGKLLPDHEPKDEEKDTISACLELIKEIETILNDKLGDNAPVLRELREPFETYQKNFSFKEEPKKAAPPPASSPTLDIPATQSVASANDIKKAFKSCHSTLYQIAKLKRAEKLSDPLPYRIVRASAWMSIEKMPFLQNGKFVVPAPPQNQILQLLEQQEYATLIETVENMFANPDVQPANAYWLDAHRFTATALEALGPQYNQAKQTVIEELAVFLRRFPKLPELHFNDDTPFADAQTKVWITEQVLTTQSEPEPVSGGGGEEEVKTLKEAKQLASQGKFAEGLLVLQNAIQSAKNQREKFVGLLEQARFCYDMDHVELAKPMLDFLEQQVACFNLEEWEPMLSVEVARLLLMCKDTNRQLYARLCRLDVASALTLENRK
jgi:type VI secretion system protein VasJ